MKITSTKIYNKQKLDEQIDEASLFNARRKAEMSKQNLDHGARSMYSAAAVDDIVANNGKEHEENRRNLRVKNGYVNILCYFGETSLALKNRTSTMKFEVKGKYLTSHDTMSEMITLTDPDNRNEYVQFKVSNLTNGIFEDGRFYNIQIIKVTNNFNPALNSANKGDFKGLYVQRLTRINNRI